MTISTKMLGQSAIVTTLAAMLAVAPLAESASANSPLGKLLVGGAVGFVAGKAIANNQAQAAQIRAQQQFNAEQQARQRAELRARQREATAVNATPRRVVSPPAQSFSGERTALTQEYLNTLGFDAGPVDGIFGSQTQRAIAEYQALRGFPATGRLSPVQFETLESEHQEANRASLAPRPTAAAPAPAPSVPTRASTFTPVPISSEADLAVLEKLSFPAEVGALLKGDPEPLKVSVDSKALAESMFTAYHRTYAAQCGAFLDASSTQVQSRIDGGAIPIRADYAALFSYLDAKSASALPSTSLGDELALQDALGSDMSLILQSNGCASTDTRTFERSLLKAVTV